MTIDEAIEVLENGSWRDDLDEYISKASMNELQNALDMAIAALREQEERRWIPVTERLPEPKENAICLNRHGETMIGTYTEWGWVFPGYYENPTHWMPLPEPPKGE